MTLITYAQNFEDVLLWRVLKHVDRGFYIDIGAQDPVHDSVSLAFYEKGWRGVHVEPTRQYSDLLRKARPDEPVEQVAIGDGAGTITFYEFADTGLSTADGETAQRHHLAGRQSIQTEVDVVSLDDLLDRHGGRDIHWLKIDVEGLEASVVASWRTSPQRPWLLVIESTKPLTQDESYADWEPIILAKGYRFAYFDGLNRFYVHDDHSVLASALALPPNVFDDFQVSATSAHTFYRPIVERAIAAETRADEAVASLRVADQLSRAEQARADEAVLLQRNFAERMQKAEHEASNAIAVAQAADSRAAKAKSAVQHADSRAMEAERRARHAEALVHAMRNSSSWRVTAPARWTVFQASLLKQHGPASRSKALAKKIAVPVFTKGAVFISERPKLRYGMASVAKATGVHQTIRAAYLRVHRDLVQQGSAANNTRAGSYMVEPVLMHLTPRARHIYQQISGAMAVRKPAGR